MKSSALLGLARVSLEAEGIPISTDRWTRVLDLDNQTGKNAVFLLVSL